MLARLKLVSPVSADYYHFRSRSDRTTAVRLKAGKVIRYREVEEVEPGRVNVVMARGVLVGVPAGAVRFLQTPRIRLTRTFAARLVDLDARRELPPSEFLAGWEFEVRPGFFNPRGSEDWFAIRSAGNEYLLPVPPGGWEWAE